MHQVSATMRSITLSWPQPEQPNGIILDYEIRYYEKVSQLWPHLRPGQHCSESVVSGGHRETGWRKPTGKKNWMLEARSSLGRKPRLPFLHWLGIEPLDASSDSLDSSLAWPVQTTLPPTAMQVLSQGGCSKTSWCPRAFRGFWSLTDEWFSKLLISGLQLKLIYL